MSECAARSAPLVAQDREEQMLHAEVALAAVEGLTQGLLEHLPRER